MLLNSPKIIYFAILAACLVLFYNRRITSTTQAYFSSESIVPEIIHVGSNSADATQTPPTSAADQNESIAPAEIVEVQTTTQLPEIQQTPAPEVQVAPSDVSSTKDTEPTPKMVFAEEAPSTKETATETAVPENAQPFGEENQGPKLTVDGSIVQGNLTTEQILEQEQQRIKEQEEQRQQEYLWTNNATTFLSGSRVAVIVEDRPLTNMVPLILHFASVLGPDWPVVLYTKTNTPPMSASLQRLVNIHNVYVRALPDFVHFGDQASVSRFLTTPWLWNQLAPADHVLIFQADSIICSNSPMTIDNFLEYDLIGAPIAEAFGKGFNGGLSLRNRNKVLEVIHKAKADGEINTGAFEDQWFYQKMLELPIKPNGQPGANLPVEDVAKTFAVETIKYSFPFGYHQVQRWQKSEMKQVKEWCPEVALATGILLINNNKSEEEMEVIRLEEAAEKAAEKEEERQRKKAEQEEKKEKARIQAEEEKKKQESEALQNDTENVVENVDLELAKHKAGEIPRE